MNNKRSASRKGYFRASRGYSLLELMLALSMAAVLAAVGVPAFTKVSLDNRRATVANELLASLMLARSEAGKRGQSVVVCAVAGPAANTCAGHDWSKGWLVAAWSDLDNDGVVGESELDIVHRYGLDTAHRMVVSAGNFTASPPVAPAGTVVLKPYSDRSSNGTITLCDRRGASEARAVIVSSNGRARISRTRANGGALACP